MIEHVLCLLLGAAIVLTDAVRPPIDTEDACHNEYDTQYIDSRYFKYNGHPTEDIVLEDEGWGFRKTDICEINFATNNKEFALGYKLCFQLKSLDLDCGSVIEYDDFFHDTQYSCEQNYSSTFEEVCFTTGDTTIIIRKVDPKARIYESATIHVYTKEFKPTTFQPTIVEPRSNYTWVIILFALGLVILLVGVTVYILKIKHKRSQQQLRNTQTRLSNNADEGNHPSMVLGNTVRQPADGCYVHQTEYPGQNSAAVGKYQYQPVAQSQDVEKQSASDVSPSAPPEESLLEEPPPSYESVINT